MSARRKPKAGSRGMVNEIEFEVGRGNVFADLELSNAGERAAKARLAGEINAIIQRNGWKQEVAASKLKTHQPTISALRQGRLKSITYDRLMGWLILLGRSVEIRVRPGTKGDAHVEVAIAAR